MSTEFSNRMGMRHKSKDNQPQVTTSSSAEENNETSYNGSPSKIPRFPTSAMDRFQMKARIQQQRLMNINISSTSRKFMWFIIFCLLAGLHTVVVTTHLQRNSGMTADTPNAFQTAKASFKAPEKEPTPAPTHRTIDLNVLEKKAEHRRAYAAKRVERMRNAELALLGTSNITIRADSNSVRQLTLNDIEIGEFIANGAINIVAMARLPEWWYKQYSINKEVQFVIKIAVGVESDELTKQAERECEVIETLTRDNQKSQKLSIVQAVFMSRTIPNPFRKKRFPSNFPKGFADPIRNAKTVVVIVQPYLDLDYIHDLFKFHDIRCFVRSLLKVLEYAHSLGVNNFDLSDSNVRVGKNGEAVVMDWNANRKLGEDMYDPMANLWFSAPEGMITIGPNGESVRLTSISARDIWSVGIILVFLMYQPCQWINPDVPRLRNKHSLLREIVRNVGGETIIPIGDNIQLDLAERVGLKRDSLLNKKWKMPLYDLEQDDPCDAMDTEAYMVQYSAKNKELEYMHDFLRSIMKLSLAERPNATTLLNHPFMDF